ncbi:MAG: hypothetical protein N2037_14520 [Acidimicrobiales bacterium]|nr:hypothetical protein [Acidimicrobiales bacterium]
MALPTSDGSLCAVSVLAYRTASKVVQEEPMAGPTTPTSSPSESRKPAGGRKPAGIRESGSRVDRRARLAELVEELTGVDRGLSLHALRMDDLERADALEAVARAMITVDQPSPVRVAAYLNRELPREPILGPDADSRRWAHQPPIDSPAERAARVRQSARARTKRRQTN